MKNCLFQGVCTAQITPFSDGKIDWKCFDKLLKRQVASGVDAICVLGTTGEPCTLSLNEKKAVVMHARKIIPHNIKLIVGTGSNNTKTAIRQTLMAKQLGADGALVVTPYYNKANSNGILQYYSQICSSCDLPIIAYNVPSRTGVNIKPNLALRLSEIDGIVGIKEASGDIKQILELFEVAGKKMAIYCGDDILTYLFLCLGGQGVVSVSSNLLPKQMVHMCKSAFCNNQASALEVHKKLLPLHNALQTEINPVAIKTIMSHFLLCKKQFRLPLCESDLKTEKAILSATKHYSDFV